MLPKESVRPSPEMIYGEASYEASCRVSKMVYKNHVGAEIPEESRKPKYPARYPETSLITCSHSAGLLPLQTGNPF